MTLSTFWPVLGPLLIKADTATPPAYVYVARLGKYRNTATGQFVSLEAIFNLRDTNETATVDTLARLSLALSDGQLPTDAWFLAMQQQLRRLTVQQGALGAGGFTALTKRDLKRMDRALQEDWPRLQAFGEAIAKGQLSEAQIRARVNMYAGHARTQFYAAQRRPVHKRSEVVLERRLIKPGEVCPLCSYLASLGWQPYGSLPLPGQPVADWTDGQCYTACRCDLERQVFTRTEAKRLVQPVKAWPGVFHRNFVNKGGEGSGNFDHAGRPGEVGGSAPRTYVNFFGDQDALKAFHLTPDDVDAMVQIGIQDTECGISIEPNEEEHTLRLMGEWKLRGKQVGYFTVTLDAQAAMVHLDYLAFKGEYMGQHRGTQALDRLLNRLGEVGYKQAELLANVTIGRYAWAKEGAQYAYPPLDAPEATERFANWVKVHNIAGLDGRLPTFHNPQDVANYRHPDGITVKGRDIANPDVAPDLDMPLGKAFMLDQTADSDYAPVGHGAWYALIDLPVRRASATKAVAVPDTLGKGWVTVLTTGKSDPDASDAACWPQYLTAEEGDPSFAPLVKGGPGSGNFGHHGRPGEVGGSAPALDPDLTFPDEMEFDQHPSVLMSGDLTDLYQTFHIHPADLAAVCDLGLPDVSIHVMAIKKHNGAMSVVGAWKTDHNAEVGSFERELAADAQSAHLETLAFSKGYLDQGLGTKVARGWYRLLANAGYQQAELYADSTIGKYAWAKEGAQYQSSWLASDRTRKFADWVKLRNVPGLDGRLPTFANPQDVANYKHPDGYTLTGKDIQNVEVPDTLVMPLGKAFMLDNYGHGNWDATLDLTRWRETGATGKAVNMGDATDLCQIEGTGGSDAVFWAQYLTEAEGDPILGFDPAPTTKGGEGSGNFGHHGRPGEVGGSAPADAFTADHASDLVDRLPEEVDDATKEREREEGYTSPGHPDVKIKGQLYRLKEYGLTREDAANFLDLGVPNVGCRGSVSVMSEMIGEDSRIHENVLWLQGEWLDTKTGQPIGGASIYFFEGAEDVQFDILDLEGKYINTGAGVALAKRWVGLTATRGYSHAIVFADLTIGKYAWAKEGADYLDPKDARKATNRFGLWVEKRKVPGLDGRLPTFQHASEAARYQHPDGYMLKGRDIDNPDVPPDMALPVGKAFMLDDAYASWGHGSWHASLDLTRVRDMLNGTHKAADVPNTWPSRRGLIFVGHDVPGGSDALFWAQYLTEGEGDPVFGVGPIVKGGAGSGNFGHAGRPGEVGGSAPGDGVHTPVLVDGEPERLAEYRLTQADLEYMLDLGLPDIPCHATVRYDADEEALHILGYWEDQTGTVIGGFERVLNKAYDDVYLEMLYFNAPYMSQGLGTRISTRWFERLADRGYESASLYADLTIGKYAWAKEGAQYSDEQLMPFKISRKFAQWVKARRIPGITEADAPIFHNPQEVANYVHPDGFTLKGEDIDNTDVPPDMVLPLGKAFMLDKGGHDSWNATVNLKEWRSKGASAKASAPAGATTKATGRRGINRATAQYAIVGHDVPGGSDAVFWAQYLSEEEGDPLFGFSPTPVTKGGEGSGNFDHAGRPGEVGGSAPTTATLDRVWTGEQHEGEATVNKLETGAIGEGIVMDVLSQLHDVPFGTVNVNVNNAPFDVSGDSLAVEVKTGLATNGKSAQHWRATIGQPGKAETELLKQMSAEEKRAHNERKMQAILDRKHALLQKMSEEAGREIHPMTMGLILSGDGTRADVFAFDGFHLRLPWNKYATPEHFLGTYDVPSKTMHWHERAAKAVDAALLVDALSGATPQNTESSLNLSEVEQKALAAALDAVDADFQKVFEWWIKQDKGE